MASSPLPPPPPHQIKVSAKREIARGSERHVYRVKKSPDVLLKVMRSKYLRRIAKGSDRSLRGWIQIRQAYALYRREQKTWTDAMLRAAVRGALPPLAGVGELVMTPQGLGQLVERVRDESGNTAPTLYDLTRIGPLETDQMIALNAFVAALYDWHIPAYDLGAKNIVWHQRRGAFVLVDGFGDRSVLPLKTWIRTLNDRRLDRAFAKTTRGCPLHWDVHNRRFVILFEHTDEGHS